jgi:hypothetical protein
MLDTGCWILDAGCWMLDADNYRTAELQNCRTAELQYFLSTHHFFLPTVHPYGIRC